MQRGFQEQGGERTCASIPLKVTELQKLHPVLHIGGEIWDRIFAGAVLFCVYARATWGDLMRASSVIEDFGKSGTTQDHECTTT